MNCFVIMPFAAEFDDVYAVIKSTVESVASESKGRCFRLDEARPAGRITDRLLAELRSATICVADLTETKPNVMWELGFAMALEKPTIIVTQSLSSLPFDIKDMQSVEYNRNRLSATLAGPLRQSLLDTLSMVATGSTATGSAQNSAVGALLNEILQLKTIVGEAVSAWRTDAPTTPQPLGELQPLAGHWFDPESGSHVYSRVIRGELVSPYCFSGNSRLTGVFFDWRRTGDYWFARYQWLGLAISGFAFLRMESLNQLKGAWWSSEYEANGADVPPPSEGVPANWVKQTGTPTPEWAESFFRGVEREGLASLLARFGPTNLL